MLHKSHPTFDRTAVRRPIVAVVLRIGGPFAAIGMIPPLAG